MSLNFKDILTEQNSPKNEKFINMMMGEMKKFFENRYEGTHWTSAANFGLSNSAEKYRGYLEKVKSLGKQVDQHQKKFNNIEKLSAKEARELSSSFNELQREYLDNLHRLTHIGELFAGDFGKQSFIEKFAIPLGVLIEVYDRFHEEIYKPGVIEYNKTKGEVQLEYGLPNSDYGGVKYYDSLYGTGRYLILKDNVNDDYLLGINHDWQRKWKDDGFDPEKLYYKRYNSLGDIKNELVEVESGFYKENIKSAEVDISPEHLDRTFEYMRNLDLDEIQREADEEQTTLEHMLGEEVYNFTTWKNDFNVGDRESQTIARYYLDYKDIIDQLNF